MDAHHATYPRRFLHCLVGRRLIGFIALDWDLSAVAFTSDDRMDGTKLAVLLFYLWWSSLVGQPYFHHGRDSIYWQLLACHPFVLDGLCRCFCHRVVYRKGERYIPVILASLFLFLKRRKKIMKR